jgi:hypothetical protein
VFSSGACLILSRGTALANPGSGGSSGGPPDCTREYIKNITVLFSTSYPPTSPNFPNKSGNVFSGAMSYTKVTCKNGVETETPASVVVLTGGYLASVYLKPGSDTAWPPGAYTLSTAYHVGVVAGHYVDGNGTIGTIPRQRTVMKVHFVEERDNVRKDGSSGCIVFTNDAQWAAFKRLMANTRMTCSVRGKCKAFKSVPLNVNFENVAPNYNWIQ